jgi:hypothetical protein
MGSELNSIHRKKDLNERLISRCEFLDANGSNVSDFRKVANDLSAYAALIDVVQMFA